MPPKITRVRWSASNLPWGISFNEQTGIFTGTPDEEGEYIVPVKVETNFGKDTKDVIIRVIRNIAWEKVSMGLSQDEIMPGSPIMLRGNNGFIIYIMYAPTSGGLRQRYRYGTFVESTNAGPNIAYNDEKALDNVYGTIVSSNWSYIYFIGDNADGKIIYYGNGGYTIKTLTPPFYTNAWYAACYSPSINAIFYFSKDGNCIKITSPFTTSPTVVSSYYATGITNINTNCAAWSAKSAKMCVSSLGGRVAASADGVTWENAVAPDNLVELVYREDLEKFFAHGENTKLFYVSDDGLTWTVYNDTPIPLDEVHSVAYSAIYGYCAIGYLGSETYSAHSENLTDWTFKKMATKNIKFTNVIFCSASNNSFLAVPASGGGDIYRLQYE